MIICLVMRHFAAAVERLHTPVLDGVPLVLLHGRTRRRVVATDSLARHVGVMPGQSFTEALGLCPTAQFMEARESIYRRVLDDLVDVLRDYANKLEPEYQPMSAAIYLGQIEGLAEIPQVVKNLTGILPGVGSADTKFVARVAAGQAADRSQPIHVPSGQARRFLAAYPMTLLPLDKEMARRLPLLGIHTLEQYAALPRFAAWEQFGKHGRWLHDLANGIDIRPIQSKPPTRVLRETYTWDDPVTDKTIVQRVGARLTEQLIASLGDLEAHKTTLMIRLENRTLLETEMSLPVRTLTVLMRQLTGMIDKLVIPKAIVGLEIRLTELEEVKPVQLSLFADTPNQKRMVDYLPQWVEHHKTIEFYRFTVSPSRLLPERRFELHQVVAG